MSSLLLNEEDPLLSEGVFYYCLQKASGRVSTPPVGSVTVHVELTDLRCGHRNTSSTSSTVNGSTGGLDSSLASVADSLDEDEVTALTSCGCSWKSQNRCSSRIIENDVVIVSDCVTSG